MPFFVPLLSLIALMVLSSYYRSSREARSNIDISADFIRS